MSERQSPELVEFHAMSRITTVLPELSNCRKFESIAMLYVVAESMPHRQVVLYTIQFLDRVLRLPIRLDIYLIQYLKQLRHIIDLSYDCQQVYQIILFW
jgi:hypothetical protein